MWLPVKNQLGFWRCSHFYWDYSRCSSGKSSLLSSQPPPIGRRTQSAIATISKVTALCMLAMPKTLSHRPTSSNWIEALARLGYATKGLVYSLIGLLALQAAFTAGGKTTDSQGALTTLANQPFGQLLLIVSALGFVGYALWRLVEVLKDPEHPGAKTAETLFHRLSYLISAGIYLGLAFTALQLAMGNGGGDGNTNQIWITRVMALPFGRWLVGLGGAIVIGGGLSEVLRGAKAKFRKNLKLQQMSGREQSWALRAGKVGLIARGIVFAMLGFLTLQAAYQANPERAEDAGGALQVLQQWTNPWVFAAIALGLLAFGIHMFFMARYGRIPTGK